MISRLVVLISGSGTNLQAILDACAGGSLAAQVVQVVSNKKDAFGLERARRAGVPVVYHPKPKSQDRRLYDSGLADLVASTRPDFVVLAGWMRLLSAQFLGRFPYQVINLHPVQGLIQSGRAEMALEHPGGLRCTPVINGGAVWFLAAHHRQPAFTRGHGVWWHRHFGVVRTYQRILMV